MANRLLREYVISEPFGDITELKNFDITNVQDGVLSFVLDVGFFTFDKLSTAVGDDYNVIVPSTNPSKGRWLRITRHFLECDPATSLIKFSENITGYGDIALQNANNVSVSGGSIDGTVIGKTSPSDGFFNNLTVNTIGSFSDLGFTSNTKIGLRINNLTTEQADVASGNDKGSIYYDTTDEKLKVNIGNNVTPNFRALMLDTVTPFVTVDGNGGATYTTLKDAIDAGEKYIFVIGNTTETGAVNIVGKAGSVIGVTIIVLDHVVIDYGSNSFYNIDVTNGAVLLSIMGGTHRFSFSVADQLVNTTGSSSESLLYFERCVFLNESTVANSLLIDRIDPTPKAFFRCVLKLPDLDNCGMRVGKAAIVGLQIQSGGSNCSNAITCSTGSNVSGIYFNNFFRGDLATATFSDDAVVNNITNNNRVRIVIGDGAGVTVVSGLNLDDGNSNIDILNDSIVSDFYTYQVNVNGSNVCISNGYCELYNSYSSPIAGNKINNLSVLNGVTLNDGLSIYSNCRFSFDAAATDVVINEKNITLSSCAIGEDSLANTATVTINSGIEKTFVSGCLTNSAINDNGLNSELFYRVRS